MNDLEQILSAMKKEAETHDERAKRIVEQSLDATAQMINQESARDISSTPLWKLLDRLMNSPDPTP